MGYKKTLKAYESIPAAVQAILFIKDSRFKLNYVVSNYILLIIYMSTIFNAMIT